MHGDQQEKVPKVFISYSHDNTPHKAWVAEHATKLRENGIDVRFDRWDLRRGEDVAKFMEQSVTWADRVLMICTDAYVRKADEGKGGVGYEAMIVTGELIKDLGTAKFIPIIRQDGGKSDVPKFMGTRFYVNLSEGQKLDEEFQELLRELHNEPALKKPAIGKSPFAKTPAGNESHTVIPTPSPVPAVGTVGDDVSDIYRAALEIARQGDLVAWRQLSKQAKSPISARLADWRKNWEGKRLADGGLAVADLPAMCVDGLSAYAPLLCVALAGVESGREAFNNQAGVLDEIMFPKDWQGSGLTVMVEFPDTAAYVYQALHGALCLETDQLQLAVRLVMTRIQRPYESESHRLFENAELIGWPKSLQSCTVGWSYLVDLSEKLPWVAKIFGDVDSYKSALHAYYLTLNVFELATVLAAGREEDLNKNEFWIGIPVISAGISEEQKRKAYRLLTRNPKAMVGIWEGRGVSTVKMKAAWPKWLQHTQNTRGRLGYWISSHSGMPHKNLFDDLVA